MRSRVNRATFLLALAAFLLPGLVPPACAQRYVPSGDPYLPRVEYSDGLVSINKRCTVRKILMTTTTRPVYINGRPLGFCCPMCSWTFVITPWRYLNEEKLSVNCPVNKYKPAVIDKEHLSWVNWELYFFSDLDAKARFDKDPLRYCGKLTDPVTGKRFQPRFWSPKIEERDRMYYFSSNDSKKKYLENPRAYSFRRID
jgi:YHS domain-containing protein